MSRSLLSVAISCARLARVWSNFVVCAIISFCWNYGWTCRNHNWGSESQNGGILMEYASTSASLHSSSMLGSPLGHQYTLSVNMGILETLRGCVDDGDGWCRCVCWNRSYTDPHGKTLIGWWANTICLFLIRVEHWWKSPHMYHIYRGLSCSSCTKIKSTIFTVWWLQPIF